MPYELSDSMAAISSILPHVVGNALERLFILLYINTGRGLKVNISLPSNCG